MLTRLLHLEEGQLRRLLPFFGLYAVLFSALSLAEGLALSMFVQDVGARHLPTVYAFIAVLNAAFVGWYFFHGHALNSVLVFNIFIGSTLAMFLTAWAFVRFAEPSVFSYGLLYVSREVSSVLLIMHFGTYVQEYFPRVHLPRILPVVYSGGRLGGIAGGAMLENLSGPVGLIDLMLVSCGLVGVALAWVIFLSARLSPDNGDDAPASNPTAPPDPVANAADGPAPDIHAARATLGGFLRYVWHSRLLFWITCTSTLFVILRWFLNFQYNHFFEEHFREVGFQSLRERLGNGETEPGRVAMAQFLGRYTQIALLISLGLQLLVVSRVISKIGVRAMHIIYSTLVVTALALNLGTMTLTLAIFCRFVAAELRLSVRNPVMQIITSDFPKLVRPRVRAWSIGLLVPISTLTASGILTWFVKNDLTIGIPWLGMGLGAVYLFCVFQMGSSYSAYRPNNRRDKLENGKNG